MHHARYKKHGDTDTVRIIVGDLRGRLESKIRPSETGCWEWAGTHGSDGYTKVSVGGRGFYTHRVMYEVFVGEIPEGYQIDHLCRNRGCVNPAHLEAVTPSENMRRAWAARRAAAQS